MNNDRISNTPGGEQMLAGAIVFLVALLFYQGFRYSLGDLGQLVVLGFMLFGAAKIGHGIYLWKVTDPETFAQERGMENLLVDVPIREGNYEILHEIEDALIELIRNSKTVEIDLHSIDKANAMGTINLHGRNADAMFAHVYATLARFAVPNGLHLFPKPGQPVDTEIRGKRLLMDLPSLEISLKRAR